MDFITTTDRVHAAEVSQQVTRTSNHRGLWDLHGEGHSHDEDRQCSVPLLNPNTKNCCEIALKLRTSMRQLYLLNFTTRILFKAT